MKNVFLGMSVMLNGLLRERKEMAFKNLIIHHGTSGPSMASDQKFKGKMLMGLK